MNFNQSFSPYTYKYQQELICYLYLFISNSPVQDTIACFREEVLTVGVQRQILLAVRVWHQVSMQSSKFIEYNNKTQKQALHTSKQVYGLSKALFNKLLTS